MVSSLLALERKEEALLMPVKEKAGHGLKNNTEGHGRKAKGGQALFPLNRTGGRRGAR